MQNLDYLIYIHNKIKSLFFSCPFYFSKNPNVSNISKVLWHVWCVLYNKLLFWISGRIPCILLYMGTYFKNSFRHFSTPRNEFVRPPKSKSSQKCEQFSYWGFGVLNCPKWSPLYNTMLYIIYTSEYIIYNIYNIYNIYHISRIMDSRFRICYSSFKIPVSRYRISDSRCRFPQYRWSRRAPRAP